MSLGYILLISLVAIFAYQLAPDQSKNANQMHLSIHSKPPGYTSKILRIVNSQGRITEEIPIQKIKWENNQLEYLEQGTSNSDFQPIPLELYPLGTSYSQVENEFIKDQRFLLGTDKFGRDILSRMIIGSRISLSIGLIAVLISLFIGVLLGGYAGYYGGKIDQFILWIINVVWSIPSLLVIIAITLALGKGFWQVFIAVGLTMWVDIARLVRGQVISVKQETYIQAVRSLGFSSMRIFVRHIFPVLIPSIIVICTANFASAILIESGLSFLGIGAQPPIPSWGGMIKDNYRYILLGKPYLALIPGIAIMSLVLAFMLLGNSLRDALDIKS